MRGTTHLTWRDRLATLLVAAAALLYVVRFTADGAASETDVRVVTGIVLALGLGASVAGIAALVTGRETWLLLLVLTTVLLWAMSTMRHAAAGGGAPRSVTPPATP